VEGRAGVNEKVLSNNPLVKLERLGLGQERYAGRPAAAREGSRDFITMLGGKNLMRLRGGGRMRQLSFLGAKRKEVPQMNRGLGKGKGILG